VSVWPAIAGKKGLKYPLAVKKPILNAIITRATFCIKAIIVWLEVNQAVLNALKVQG